MKKTLELFSGLLGGLIGASFVLFLGFVNIYGIYHTFSKHNLGFGVMSVFIPPLAWYMAAEGVFWHDDFANVDCELRLKNDVKTLTSLLGASSNIRLTNRQEFNAAIESFAKELKNYPTEKKNYLEQFGTLYIEYFESLVIDLMKNFEDAISKGGPLVIKESSKTLSLEKRFLAYQGTEEFISDLKLGLYALNELENLRGNLKEKGKNREKFSENLKEKFLEIVFLMLKTELNKMENTYTDIFGKSPQLRNPI